MTYGWLNRWPQPMDQGDDPGRVEDIQGDEMPSYKTAFGSFLKTEDLQGKQIRVVVEDVVFQDVKGEQGVERKLVAKFAGKDKGLILNMTNCESLTQITGTDDYEQWAGHTVILYPATTKFGPKMVPCLRIRENVTAKPAPPPPPVEDELTAEEIFDGPPF